MSKKYGPITDAVHEAAETLGKALNTDVSAALLVESYMLKDSQVKLRVFTILMTGNLPDEKD